ncbi:uncharacterized protein [Chironomus tepperi]|uniref:uncharacterized protein isoform X2 n=1 Tax=Chironomus tepperi TaxID=113505 RepID=UPI00391F1A95
MFRRNSNINDLINRFEVTNTDDFDMTENVRQPQSYVRVNRMQNGDENFGNDENRSIVRAYSNTNNIDSAVFVRRTTNVSMSVVKEFIKQLLFRISAILEMISRFPFPRMSVMSFGLTSLLAVFIAPRGFTDKVLYPGFKILFTIIYPAYRSFKAVRNKNLKEYLKWLVFWIVYALFTCLELVTDALLPWFPFYNEIKVIFLIWLLGPSSRGSMKIYKNIIHPILVSREQEIDDMIQLAQEHGYMQVFRLSSKSVNYANKIIMQDAKTDSSFIVSRQLMQNISLSNLSDVGTNQSIDDNDDIQHMRRYSIEKMPIYGNNQMNYSYENLESRRKPSFDYKYDDMMSSGYSSPISPSYQRYPITHSQHHQRGAFIEENAGTDISRKITVPESNQVFEQPPSTPRKASIKELTADEIILAYRKLQMENVEKATEAKETTKNDADYNEFLEWMKLKRNNEMSAIKENNLPLATPSNHKLVEKVNDDINVANCMDDKSLVDEVSVSNSKADDVNVTNLMVQKPEENLDCLVNSSSSIPDDSSFLSIEDEEVVTNEQLENTKIDDKVIETDKTESDQEEVEFDEFKDAVSEDEDKEYLNVPLIIQEDNETTEIAPESKNNELKINNEKVQTETLIPKIIEDAVAHDSDKIMKETETNTVNAKMMLTNDPLQIVTHLSSSSVSLASSLDGSENKVKRPAKHSKGRAPQPPAASSTSNEILPIRLM